MLAAVVQNNQLHVDEIADPLPDLEEALVRVAASSINAGEVRGIRSAPHWQLSHKEQGGWVPGWDFAGTVEKQAKSGKGLAVGTRVVGWTRQGAWAQRTAVPWDQMVALPDQVSFKDAATLPIAGLTAWHALKLGGLKAGKKVLVTGAAGGVGRFALQLCAAANAPAIGVVGSKERAQSLAHITTNVSVGLPKEGEFDIILECVGGDDLAATFKLVAMYGTIVSYGNASNAATSFHADAAFRKPCLNLRSFSLHGELARCKSAAEGLGDLVALLAAGKLKTEIDITTDLKGVMAACDSLTARKVNGKAVLVLD